MYRQISILFCLNYGKVIQFDLTNASFEMTQYDFNPIDSFLVQKQKSVQKCISLDWYYKKGSILDFST